ncbi:MAG TPA: biotin--[acetyl-CoA-carboxylase] ligase [Paracoccaceae bacterium]|nr:biotin--[acetyl-CoA-carboxylase] ligase [Paracoccaceae bacterium]
MADWPEGVGRVLLERIDSTNAEAGRRAAAGETGPVWIMARQQTAARGRRGRAWIAPEGNFGASLLMPAPGGPAEAALRSFTAALALREALAGLTGLGEGLSLKWPNDVLLEGAKLAGILLEGAVPATLVIGIGVNLRYAPPLAALEPGATAPVSLFEATGIALAPEALLTPLAAAFAGWEARHVAEGFHPVRAAWLAQAAGLGRRVRARLPGTTLEGIFETVDETGALVLNTGRARQRVNAADIQFS